MTERLNCTDLATEFRMSNGRAANLLRQAGIERDGRKLYDADDAREVLRAAIDPSRAAGNRIAGRGNVSPSPEISELASVRVGTERARARKLELEVALKSNQLVSRVAANEAAIDFATHVRNGFLGLAPKIAAKLVGKSCDDITSILDAAVRETLVTLSDVDNWVLGIST